jgi:glycosyltransferase involved in cell wall biosynthesis
MCSISDSVESPSEEAVNFEKEYISELDRYGIEVCFLEKKKNKNRVKAVYAIRMLYNAFRPDIVHAHSEVCAVYAATALLGTRCILAETIHNNKVFHPILVRCFLSQRITSFISISAENTMNMTAAHIPRRKISLIQNGTDLRRFSCKDRKFNNIPVCFIAVGRLEKQKDYPFLLRSYTEAVNKLRLMGEPLPKLDIFGMGSCRDEIQALIKKHGLQDCAHLRGLCNDVEKKLGKADVFVLSSSFEGFSIALIEAAASGLPIIATDVGSNMKLVASGKNGYLVGHGDVEAFSQAIVDLTLSENMRVEFSAGSLVLAKPYDVEQTAEEHIDLYGALLKE